MIDPQEGDQVLVAGKDWSKLGPMGVSSNSRDDEKRDRALGDDLPKPQCHTCGESKYITKGCPTCDVQPANTAQRIDARYTPRNYASRITIPMGAKGRIVERREGKAWYKSRIREPLCEQAAYTRGGGTIWYVVEWEIWQHGDGEWRRTTCRKRMRRKALQRRPQNEPQRGVSLWRGRDPHAAGRWLLECVLPFRIAFVSSGESF